jgi:predicted dehydrogenase
MKTLGLIGVGAIAQSYVQALAAGDVARIGAICDANANIREAAAEALGCPAYATVAELIAGEDIDGAIIATPPATHRDLACALLGTGIPVLCEKPLTLSAGDAKDIIASARKSGALISMASKFRYVEDINRARSILASGVLGDILMIDNLFSAPVDMRRRWNSDPAVSGGGVIIDNGTHSVEIVRHFGGSIRRVAAVAQNCVGGLGVEDTASLFVETESGARGRIELSWTLAKTSPVFVTVYATEGVLEVGWQQSRYRRTNDRDWTKIGDGYDKIAAFRANVANFCAAIDGTQPLLTDWKDAIASVHVIQAAYRSIAEGGFIDVPVETDLATIRGAAGRRAI